MQHARLHTAFATAFTRINYFDWIDWILLVFWWAKYEA